MAHPPQYGMTREVDGTLDVVEGRLRDALMAEGFGILTEIDVRETLKKKLEIDFRPYKILGACNPALAHGALSAEIDVGLLLPCNVILYAGDRADRTVVSILDPVQQIGMAGVDELTGLAGEARDRLARALESV